MFSQSFLDVVFSTLQKKKYFCQYTENDGEDWFLVEKFFKLDLDVFIIGVNWF